MYQALGAQELYGVSTDIKSLPPKGSLSVTIADAEEKPSKVMNCLQTVLPFVFKKPEAFGEGLTIHHSLITTRRKFKPWGELT